MAGGGILRGSGYGTTDEVGFTAVEEPTCCYDLHARALHRLGIDHTRWTYDHNGLDRQLTDMPGHVIKEIIA
jgi:hypothetical protein